MPAAKPQVIRILAVLCWLGAIVSLPALVHTGLTTYGWDLHVYANAVRSLQAGHDPYADGIAVQQAFHATPQAHDASIMPPYTYVYSPITLPVLRLIAHLPLALSGAAYWFVYACGTWLMVWSGMRFFRKSERTAMLLMAPLAIHFPGMLSNNVIFSGNLAYILYGVVLALAWLGWSRNVWWPFYVAVALASCVKAPLLTLLAIPVFSARRQWLPAGITAVAGLLLFGVQRVMLPNEFPSYLKAVALQFDYNADFGLGPAGLVADWLFLYHLPFTMASTSFYVFYAASVVATLWLLSQRLFHGQLTLQQLGPVLLLGVILLNPRIKEYDVAPLTLPMALVVWRLCNWKSKAPHAVIEFLLFLLALQFLSGNDAAVWKPLVGCVLSALYAAGSWQLFWLSRNHQPNKLGPSIA